MSPIARSEPGRGRFLGFATDAESRRLLGMAAAARGWVAPEIRDGGLEAVHAAIEHGTPPGFLVIDLSAARAPLPAVNALAEVCAANTRVIAIGTQNDVGLYRGLKALGVADYLVKPLDGTLIDAALGAALEAAEPAAPAAGPARRAEIIAFVGSRGGAGATAIAASVATLLAASGRRVALLDLDFQGGSLALDLDSDPSPAIVPLLESPDRVDPVVVDQAFRDHPLGFRLLAADAALEASLAIEGDALLALVSAAAEGVDAVVIDLPRWLDRARRAVLRTADRVVLVTPPTLVGLRDARRIAGLASGLRAGQPPILVVNREGASAADLPRATFEEALGLPVHAWLPEEPRAAGAAASRGTTLAAAADPAGLGRGLAAVAALFVEPGTAPRTRGDGFFGRMRALTRALGRAR
jgi:pilus assembly protein CpaE